MHINSWSLYILFPTPFHTAGVYLTESIHIMCRELVQSSVPAFLTNRHHPPGILLLETVQLDLLAL